MSYAIPAEFTSVARRFFYPTLKNDAQMTSIGSKGVSSRTLPQVKDQSERAALYPRSFFYLDASFKPSYGADGHIRWQLLRYIVVGIGYLEQEPIIEQIAARQMQLLHMFSGEVAGGGYINSCAFDGPVDGLQSTGEDQFLRIGSRWKVKVRLSSSQ